MNRCQWMLSRFKPASLTSRLIAGASASFAQRSANGIRGYASNS
jgi:hypothetical protein